MDDIVRLAVETIRMKKQALVFCPSRASAEKTAEEISRCTNISLLLLEREVLRASSSPTKQCRRLSLCIRKGIAFHHAGLLQKQRDLIEDEFRKGRLKIICCTPTLCLSNDTEIWQPSRNTRISNIKSTSDIFALSHNKLKVMKAKNVFKNINSMRLVRITSVSGHTIKLTPNHKILIKRNGRKILIPASECKRKDKIATVGKLNIENTTKPKIGDFICENVLPFKDREISGLEFYFLGSMLGDGHSGAEIKNGKIKYKGSPTFTSRDPESVGMIIDISKGLHSISTQKVRFGSTSLVLSKTKWFREFLCRSGVDIGMRKQIHPNLMQADLNLAKYLIRGLFDTDGCVENLRHLSFSNISLKLIKDLQKLLLRFGITSRLRKRPAGFMQMLTKKYPTKESFELVISQNISIFLFHKLVGFNLRRKQHNLEKLIKKISTPIYCECKNCQYKIYRDLFSGRTNEQREWGNKKKKVIQLLGEKGELGSREIKKILNFLPRHAKGNRLNHHYELISKRRIGSRGNTEWFWQLNEVGKCIYKNFLNKSILDFFNLITCPVCGNKLNITLRKKWRDSDFEGDLFWDYVRNVNEVEAEEEVYDIVLPSKPKNDHMFVANGFIVHNSAGMSLPAFRVIIKSLKRYSGKWGMNWIPVLEYYQMIGRAGRPEYESYGEAISIARNNSEKDEIHEKFLCGHPEEICSKLAARPVLRMYLLSLISSGIIRDEKTMNDFFNKTFWAHQFKDRQELESIMEETLKLLEEWGFVKIQGGEGSNDDFMLAGDLDSYSQREMRPTMIGKRVSELYLDPLTAKHILDCLENFDEKKNAFSLLQMISHTLEMRPLLRIKSRQQEWIQEELVKKYELLLEEEPSAYDIEYPYFMFSIKTALFFDAWINERNEDFLLENYDIRPGEIRAKITTADWLLYASDEMGKLLGYRKATSEIRKLRLRIKHGAKEELLKLLKLKGVGRVRARRLFKQGIKDMGDIKKAGLTSLSQILGQKTGEDVCKQVGIEVKEIPKGKRKGQLSMKKY